MMRLLHGLFLAGTALLLVVPNIYLAVPVLLSVAGFFLARRAKTTTPITDPALRASWQALLGGFTVFALTGLLLNIYHGDTDPGAYERLIPFLLLPATAWTIRAGGWPALPWIAALGIAAILAGAHAGWEFLTDANLRAQGAAGNPIKFGHSAVVLSGLCTFAALLYPFPNRPILWRAGLIIAALAGAQASLLSGSKGGWPVLLLLAIAAAYMIARNRPLWQRNALAAAALSAGVAIAMLAPSHMVRDRISSGIGGAIHWFQSGGEVTEGSVSLRFELWSLGLHIFAENPILGAGVEGKDARWADIVATDPNYAVIGPLTSADSDLIDALANGGIIGALSLILALFGTWTAFWRWRHHPDAGVMTLARMGLTLTPAYILFGLSVSVFGISIFRAIFVSLAVTLLALITNRLSALAEQKRSTTGTEET